MSSIDERRQAIAERFLEGQFGVDVLRASYFALRLRGDELETAVRDTLERRKYLTSG